MDRRIIGVETEFGVHYSHPGSRPLTPEEVARYLFRPVVEWGRSSNVFIPNGSRLYLDVGSHPEYATAECTALDELIATDKAGEIIMQRLIDSATASMSEDGFEGTIYLYKNNADSAGNSYGSHENYLIPRTVEFRRLSEALIPFLVTRQLYAGAGTWVTRPSEDALGAAAQPHFAFSQRADHVWEGVSSATTRSRPIINTRDEPHADAADYRRLHVIVGDSNMSETTQLVRFGATDLVLRMIEAGWSLGDHQMENPIRSIRQVSHDLSGTAQLNLRSGRHRSALQLQEHYLEQATRFVAAHGPHHDRVAAVLDLWERSLEAVRTQDFTGIDTEIDWAIKHRFLTRYRDRNGLADDAPRLDQLDLSYHDITPGRGLFALLQSRGAAARVLTDDQVQEAIDAPPSTTRACLRGRFITEARAAGQEYSVDWTTLKLNDRPMMSVSTKDPFATTSERLDELLATLPQPSAADGPTRSGPSSIRPV
ncbi:Pup--protein ligase [Micrococcus terreus]|uniref:Pup--protein ligase n=1 Tax=Micrococcus terreus TaxID=574650 RepID=UPI00254D0658|nr:Pup--protein ligase [Micrococcus terreus]MDK7699921.1 Pup--protein ligase [Micrococcus terreus]WOO98311.1 Pup--protein ligase [Micrococcus terreus]